MEDNIESYNKKYPFKRTMTNERNTLSSIKKKHVRLSARFVTYKAEIKQEEFWKDMPKGKEVL